MSMFTVRINDEDASLIRAYAEMNGKSISEVMRNAIIEQIEDEYDLKAYEQAMEEYRKDPVSYTLEESMRMQGDV